MSEMSTVWSLDKSPIFSFNLAISIFLNSSDTSRQGLVLFWRPQAQVTGTFCLQLLSGHGGLWHGLPQGCPHKVLWMLQGCLQGMGHWPSWHGLLHLCLPQGIGLPQGKPQLKFSWWQGMADRCSWCPWHHLLQRTVQGGQGPVWQLWLTLCPHGLCLEQGLLQAGGLVPQGTGGYNTLAPHSQYNSSKLVSIQGGHRPEWQVRSHLCWPQESWWLQGRGQKCSISMQQRWLHLCFPHVRF